MNERDFDELSAGHALHALSEEDERAYEEALAARPDRQAHGRSNEQAAARLADAVPEVAPPAALRDRLLAQIATTPQIRAEDAAASVQPAPAVIDAANVPDDVHGDLLESDPRPGPSRMSRMWFALAASVALVIAIGAGVAVFSNQLAPSPAAVALERIEDAGDAQTATTTLDDGGVATAHWSPSLGEAVLVSDGLPELPADRAFELWFVRDGAAISAGVFRADGDHATAQLAGDMHAGDVIAVTVEQAGGSPTGDPTGDPILAIPTA
jgi:anti-sigma-K factor RskA